ncbi:hypothetical protein PHMEG_00016531 [Phytophthora megakarya]|uniref:Uncharacterized protein n=1 Tax=Phytophthora megakarya TaxID=4795 RepID=A0A225VZN9_9STRA|nr:hypothetical protein PHMEG_00016531 [Phytophthora megakarya]
MYCECGADNYVSTLTGDQASSHAAILFARYSYQTKSTV